MTDRNSEPVEAKPRRHTFTIPGRPQVKQRPRLGRGRGRRGKQRVFTPEATLVFEKHVAESYDGPRFDGPVHVRIRLHKDKTTVTIEDTSAATAGLRGDIDNYCKAILDGLQTDAAALGNDRQVVRLTATKS